MLDMDEISEDGPVELADTLLDRVQAGVCLKKMYLIAYPVADDMASHEDADFWFPSQAEAEAGP